MRCCRVFVFILLLIFTAAGTCSSLFPLFRRKDADGTGEDNLNYATSTIYYWYHEVSIKAAKNVWTISRSYTRQFECDTYSMYYTVSGALSAAGAAFGGIATLMSLAHIYIRPKCCMCFGIMFMSFLAFACFGVCVALVTVTYTMDSCGGKVTEMKKIKDQKYNIAEGFGLMCAAAGGFLLSMLFEICS